MLMVFDDSYAGNNTMSGGLPKELGGLTSLRELYVCFTFKDLYVYKRVEAAIAKI